MSADLRCICLVRAFQAALGLWRTLVGVANPQPARTPQHMFCHPTFLGGWPPETGTSPIKKGSLFEAPNLGTLYRPLLRVGEGVGVHSKRGL